jgi:hypothetical protein
MFNITLSCMAKRESHIINEIHHHADGGLTEAVGIFTVGDYTNDGYLRVGEALLSIIGGTSIAGIV